MDFFCGYIQENCFTMKVLDFRAYHKLNEDESTSVGAVDQILNLFFQAYGSLVTKIGDYPDAVKDLMEIAKEKDPSKAGKLFLSTLTKIASKVDPKYKEAADQIVLAGKKMKEAYESALETEEGKKDLEKVKEGTYDRIIGYLEALKKVASEAPKSKEGSNENKNESWYSEEQTHLFLFEKNTFPESRDEIIADITPQLTLAKDLSKNPATPALGTKFKKISTDLENLQKELSQENEVAWKKMKRRQRKDRIEEIRELVKAAKDELIATSLEGVKNLGIDKNVLEKIKQASELVSDSVKLIDAIDKEESAKSEAEKQKEKEKEEADKKEDEETFTEIKSGNSEKENLTKKGKNKDAIMKAQEKINSLLPDKEKIKADGLYGNNTEKAIQKIADTYSKLAPDLLKGIDGKSLTPDFQKFLSKMEKNKDKVKDLFK